MRHAPFLRNRRARAACGLALACAVVVPPLGTALESSMAAHMLVQFPALMLAGGLLVGRRDDADVSRWNRLGIAGLVFVALVLALAMIPRLLDLALVDARAETAKVAALLAAGAALRVSWPRSGLVVQGFFLGNVLPMSAVVGTLYLDAPRRLCNSYRLDEQELAGTMLVVTAIAVALAWLGIAGVRLYRDEALQESIPVADAAPDVALPSSFGPRAPRG